jgi:two-component system response regulator DevR
MSDLTDERIKVLLVDDHQMFAQSLARLLADEPDIEVQGIVTDALQAAPRAAELRPDVVLLDYQMPGRNGVDIATEIKADNPAVMVVMLTGSNDDQVLLAAIEAGCSGFLTKDRAAADVATTVRGAAAGEVLVAPALLARLLPRLSRKHRRIGFDLTDRESEVLRLLARGWTNAVIARHLHLSVNTVRNYVQSVLTKLDAHSKLEAVTIGVRERIIEFPTAV